MTVTPHSSHALRIAIVGGGIGGLYAALSIHQHCGDKVTIDVYEQASQYKEIGAGITLALNSAKMIHNIGLGAELNRHSGSTKPMGTTIRLADNDEVIYTIPALAKGEVRATGQLRSNILDMFLGAIQDRHAANLHVNKRIKSVEDQGGSVSLQFHDGTTATADVIIGADGIHSVVRSQFTEGKYRYSGQVAYRAVVDASDLQQDWPYPDNSVLWCTKGRHVLFYTIGANLKLNIVALAHAPAGDVDESWVSTCGKQEVLDTFADFPIWAQKVFAKLPAHPNKWRINDREPLDQWHFLGGKVILLGDSAHASELIGLYSSRVHQLTYTVLPHLGAGAGQGLEDGWVLGRALGEMVNGTDTANCKDLESVAAFYQKVRLPRAQSVQAGSRRTGPVYDLQSPEMANLSTEECIPWMQDYFQKMWTLVMQAELDEIYDQAKTTPVGTSNGA